MESLAYSEQEPRDSISFSHRTDALLSAGNDDFSEKAREKNVVPVAVRVKNKRADSIKLRRSTVRVRSGTKERSFLPPEVTADMLGQAYGWHAFWGLLNVWFISEGENGEVNRTWIPVGPAIGLFNIVRGARANNKMKDDFKRQHLLSKTVAPDSTVNGLVFISEARGQPLTFEYVGSDSSRGTIVRPDSTRSNSK